MKRVFSNRRNALLSPAILSLGGLLVGVALVLVFVRLVFPGGFIALTAPLFQVGNVASLFTGGLTASFGDRVAEATQFRELRLAYDALSNENLALRTKIEDLEKFLGPIPGVPEGVVAGVLARPPQSPYDTLVLAAGSLDGVSVSMRVFAPGSVPIGEVESVSSHASRVTLYSAPGSKRAGWVGEARIPIELVGQGGGAFRATAPRDAGIEAGMIVYLTNGGALPIGTVSLVEADLSSPAAVLSIASLTNLFSLTWVKLVP
jgi:cell shape-determining protein MreC